MSLLQAQVKSIAQQVEVLLADVCSDLELLADLSPSDTVYLQFVQARTRNVWSQVRQVPFKEVRKGLPLYCEAGFIDPNGMELISIRDGKIRSKRGVSQTVTGDHGPENFFSAARQLPAGDIYVSHLTGWHVDRGSINDATGGETVVAGEYQGHYRFAKPVYQEGKLKGVVTLALDQRHLMELTQHVLPLGLKEVVFADYFSGDYAFIFDNEGWVVTHPKAWDIRGTHRKTGQLVNPSSSDYTDQALKSGSVPFNLLYVPFIHPSYKQIAQKVLNGGSGIAQARNVSGIPRILAFAPIHFSRGQYRQGGIFGGVTLGAQANLFQQTIVETSNDIDLLLKKTINRFVAVILCSAVAVSLIAVLLARSFTRPILTIKEGVSRISRGDFEVTLPVRSKDELAFLAKDVRNMGLQLKKHTMALEASYEALSKAKERAERTSKRLEHHVDILKSIHSGSDRMTDSLSSEHLVDAILNTCLQALWFKHALLLMMTEDRACLTVVKSVGLGPEAARKLSEILIPMDARGCTAIDAVYGNKLLTLNADDSETICTEDRLMLLATGASTLLFMPISISGRSLGVLCVGYLNDQVRFEENQYFLKIIANEAAMALERAHLTEEALRRKQLMESIFTNMLSGLMVFDHKGCILSANPRACAFLKQNESQLIGRPAEDIFAPFPEMFDLIFNDNQPATPTASAVDLELADGQTIYFETTRARLASKRHPGEDKILFIFRDVTKRKKMAVQLHRSNRLVSIGTLAAGIAHEIRNPLTGIALMLDDLHDRTATSAEDRYLMQRALNEIEKLNNIITELLQFASKSNTNPKLGDVNQVVELTLFFVQKQYKKANITLTQNLTQHLPQVMIDTEKMKQALLNILLNSLSILAQDGTGEVIISTQYIDASDMLSDQPAVALSVKDNGPGITKENLEFIFDPFYTNKPGGFGLGLSITHTIVEEHAGKILAESESGHGACFTIHLPVAGS